MSRGPRKTLVEWEPMNMGQPALQSQVQNVKCGVLRPYRKSRIWRDRRERDVAEEGAACPQQTSARRSFDQPPPVSNYLSSHDSPPAYAIVKQYRHALHMNWTGGSLQRTKKANAGVLQQQKAYFAQTRTQLQNATNSPAAPFRPSYLPDHDDSCIWGLTPFGAGSVRHTGHSAKRPGERAQREPTLDKRRSTTSRHETTRYEEHATNLSHRSPSNSNAKIHIHKGFSDLHDGKHKAPEMDMDIQLFEANRKRLLTLHDWVGIGPSKPVSIRFQSSREKSRIGKRRNTTRRSHAALKRRDNGESRDKDLDYANDDDSPHMNRGSDSHQNVDNVQIRIGTDAMTNTYSAQLGQYAQSHASSRLMLFGQQESLAQQRSEKPLVDPRPHAATSASEQARHTCRAPSTSELPQCHGVARRNIANLSPGFSEQGSIIGDQLGLQCQPATMTLQHNGSSTHGSRLTHHVHGGERAFRLAFSGSSSAAGSRGRTASVDHQIGETQPFSNAGSVLPSKREHVHQANVDREHPVNVEVSAGHAIVDEGPWRTYLAISEGSSHSDTARSSILHDYPTKKQNNKAATNRSQQPTHGQGNHSRVSSSSISASLPSLRRGVEEPISTRTSGVAVIRREGPETTALRSVVEDDKNWRAFVFQSDDNLSLARMQDYACKKSPLISRYSENASSKYLPLSRAVSSVSPIAYESGPELASGAGYDAPNPRSFAPPSRSRSASPLFSRGSVERLTQSEQGDEILERKVSDEQWMTHASLQNNASSDLIASRVSVA